MKPVSPSVTYVLYNKMGGVFNYVENLLAYRRPDRFCYNAVLTDNTSERRDVRLNQSLSADKQTYLPYSLPPENLHAVLSRLAAAVGRGPGVLVASDWLELAMCSVHDLGNTVVNITHGDWDYYYDLAVMHEPIIDCFLTYTDRMYTQLRELLPRRSESIHKISYGIAIPSNTRQPAPGPLRMLYVGRLDRAKGVFDLPKIDERLRQLGIGITWTIQGTGPDEQELKEIWTRAAPVRWMGMQPMQQVLRNYLESDVLVMPSRSEGLPVALLEAAAAGVVPVVSDLASGIPEVVDHQINGYRASVGDVEAFATAISELARDRDRLELMSQRIRQRAVERFDIRERARDYQALYARWQDFRRPRSKDVKLHYGSRLDKPWLPNTAVRALRTARRSVAGHSQKTVL